MFANKNILVGITGGIAAYKTCGIIREIKKNNGNVRVVMTRAATKFVAPLTFATLSENPVLMDMFHDEFGGSTVHIEAARWADVVLVCPATANTIGKLANGVADNLLTTLVMAAKVPIILCPAMNREMYRHPIYQDNVQKLKKIGYQFVEADAGELACGEIGEGRLAAEHKIIFSLKKALLGEKKLAGKKILVTAGRTEEPIDPVRFITNRSSGKMGYAIAEAAAISGAEVTLISGPSQLPEFAGGKFIKIRTADELANAVRAEYEQCDAVIMAAAIADFKPKKFSSHKLKKNDQTLKLELSKTTDVLHWLGQRKGEKILIGFAVETQNEIKNATEKLKKKHLDMIIVNNPLQKGAAFEMDTNKGIIIDKMGNQHIFPLMDKFELAKLIIDRMADLFRQD